MLMPATTPSEVWAGRPAVRVGVGPSPMMNVSRQATRGWCGPPPLAVWVMAFLASAAGAGERPSERDSPASGLRELEEAFRSVVTKAAPSVVGIRVKRRCSGADISAAAEGPPAPPQTILVNGSGTVIREDGSILTNEHVIRAASDIEVVLHDGRVMPGRVVAADVRSDLAVLRVAVQGLAPVEMCEWESVARGQWAVLIGNPYGLGADGQLSVSVGVIANLGRRLPGLGEADDRLYADMIQTTAVVYPGNSGGPLLNLRGELVGVITAMHTRAADEEGMSFAIPMNAARRRIVEGLLEGRPVEYAWLGLSVRSRRGSAAGSADAAGEVVVESIDADGPAARAGVREGDHLLSFEGQPVGSPAELLERVQAVSVGRPVTLKLRRGGEEIMVQAVPERREVDRVSRLRGRSVLWRGLRVADLTPELRLRWQVQPPVRGVIVVGVAAGSPGGNSGIRTGDVIERVQDRVVEAAAAFYKAVQNLPGTVELELHGRGRVRVEP